jgi:predicted DNA binding CopG/RHH family protein
MTLFNLIEAFEAFKLEHTFSGSLAANLNGYMVDDSNIEILITQNRESYKKVERALTKLGYENTLPVSSEELFTFLDAYKNKKGLKTWVFQNPKLKTEKVTIRIDQDRQNFQTKSTTFKSKTFLFLNIEDTQKLGLSIEAETPYIKDLSPDLILQRFENLRFYHKLDAKREMGKSKLISMKIQEPLLDAFKQKAEFIGVPYQTQIKVLMKDWLK